MNENKNNTNNGLVIDAFIIRHIIFITFNYAFQLKYFFFFFSFSFFGNGDCGGAKNDVEFISDRSVFIFIVVAAVIVDFFLIVCSKFHRNGMMFDGDKRYILS